MASSHKIKPERRWFAQCLEQIMQEKRVSARELASRVDRPPALITSVLDGTHSPSVYLAEVLLQALGHDLDIKVL